MEGILDAIFSNIFIIMALLAGLFGFFKNEDEKEKRKRNDLPEWQDRNPNPVAREEQTVKERYDTFKQEVETTVEDIQTDATNEWYQALEDSQKNLEESLENTANRMKTSDKIKAGSLVQTDHGTSTRISVKENLTRKRLVESLIMSEVLDQPKSARQKRRA